MSSFTSKVVLTGLCVLLFAQRAHAFGAGNIGSTSTVEGVNWRHGDIEDALLTIVMARAAGGKKFDKMNVARVYFGNWLRDYSQAIDVGTVKYVSAEAIRILLWVLGFMTFGYGTKEFEVTSERLGCYRPEDHIDNPKDYADNEDATQYHAALRRPVDERVELAIDENTGMKNYIANEQAGIMTSAQHVRQLFSRSTELARQYARNNNEADLHEALRLLGTGLHCLEDWPAHSNYTELALIELGEQDVFPHVGANTAIRLPGARSAVYPVVTGTFGGVDFLHSVMGEVNDKATQSEIQQLEGTMQGAQKNDTSFLKELLAKIPEGVFGDTDEASKADELRDNALNAQMNQTRVSPREPEAFTQQMNEYVKQIYPIIEWHDETMQKISKAIDNVPILPEIIEKLEEQINIFVFGLLAPFVLPLIEQLKNELNTGSSEIIQSSKDKQLIVFNDDDCSDPTHSMLAKDHFSNILNEPAGKIASATVKWVVPQLMQCWDDENEDVNRVCTRIINGVLHHPAQRNMGEDGAEEGRQMMFRVVEEWWNNNSQHQDELRQKLSRGGVMNGENHKDGQQDCGHGCGKHISMAKSSQGQGALGGLLGKGPGGKQQQQIQDHIETQVGKAAGGGALGGIVGGIAGALSGGLLSGAFGSDDKKSKKQDYETQDGGRTQKYSEYGSNKDSYGQASYQETTYPSGESRSQYNRYEETRNDDTPNTGYQERTDTHRVQGGGYETTTQYTSQYGSEVRTEEFSTQRGEDGGEYTSPRQSKKFHSNKQYGKNDSNDDDDDDEDEEKKRLKKEKKRRQKEEREQAERMERRGSVGGGYDAGYQQTKAYDSREDGSSFSGGYGGGRTSGEYGTGREQRQERQQEYSGNPGYGGERQEYGRDRDDTPSFDQPSYSGRQEESSYSGGYGGGRQEESAYGERQQEYGSGGMPGGFGGNDENELYGGGRPQHGGASGYGGGRQEESYGGGRQEYGGNSGYGGGGYGGESERRRSREREGSRERRRNKSKDSSKHKKRDDSNNGYRQKKNDDSDDEKKYRKKKHDDSDDDDKHRRRNRSGSRDRRYR